MPNGNGPEKWPWSITDREFGALEQELKELRHDFRNLKSVVDMSGVSAVSKDEVNEFRQNVATLNQNLTSLKKSEALYREISDEIMKLKIKVYTGASIGMVVAGIIMWLVDVAFKTIDQLN
jgi:hypothetical protein